jgi:hypothetical protein
MRKERKEFKHLFVLAKNIVKGFLFLKLPAKLVHDTQIAEGFHAANDFANCIPKRRGADTDRDALLISTNDIDRHVSNGFTSPHGLTHRTTCLAHVRPEDFITKATNRLVSGNPSYPFGSSVERYNVPVPIDREHTICDTIENDFMIRACGRTDLLHLGAPFLQLSSTTTLLVNLGFREARFFVRQISTMVFWLHSFHQLNHCCSIKFLHGQNNIQSYPGLRQLVIRERIRPLCPERKKYDCPAVIQVRPSSYEIGQISGTIRYQISKEAREMDQIAPTSTQMN